MGTIVQDLKASADRATRAGIERRRIVVDPGIGFGKRGDQNYEILAELDRMNSLEFPILVGTSRKSFLGNKLSDEQRLMATASTITAAILRGAHIVRVHDVRQMAEVARVADALLKVGEL